jgi:ubiquitin-protein ligase
MAAELKKLRDAPVGGVMVAPSESDVGTWSVFVEGPDESVYSGSLFELVVSKWPCGWPCGSATVTTYQ